MQETSANRVAIVTGGSFGVGREVTRHLAGNNFAVVVNYALDQALAEAAVEEVLAANGIALAVRGNVADELDVGRLFAETIEAFGPVDVVAHAASRPVLGHDDSLHANAEQWTGLQATLTVNQQAARQVRPGGTIVNLCVARRGPSTSATGAGRNGSVEAMTRAFSRELQEHDVTVNAVAFRPEDPSAPAAVAALVGFLAGRDARGFSGQVIQVDGGGRQSHQ